MSCAADLIFVTNHFVTAIVLLHGVPIHLNQLLRTWAFELLHGLIPNQRISSRPFPPSLLKL